jgi:A/G-specific adenine glycosylase
MIELGATVCLPNGTPKCNTCPLFADCAARLAGREQELPVRKKAAPRRIEERTVLILRYGDTVALRQRPASGLLASLYEPFSLEGRMDAAEVAEKLAALDIAPLRIAPLGEGKHIFTHLEWHMVGFEVILREEDVPKICNIPLDGAKNGVFFARREEIDESYAIPGAYSAYRPYM